MNWIQNILVIATVILALYIVYDKFFKQKQNKKGCGNDGCGCN